jgi:hypothetical protein
MQEGRQVRIQKARKEVSRPLQSIKLFTVKLLANTFLSPQAKVVDQVE